MTILVTVFFTSLILLAGHSTLLYVEQKNGHRLILVRVRAFLDRLLSKLFQLVLRFKQWLITHVFKAAWHMTAYRFFQFMKLPVQKIAHYLESKMHINRRRLMEIKTLDQSKPSKLSHMREHKEATSLSKEERSKLMRESLEK